MIKINNINLEYSQIGKEPTMGYSDEFIEYTMMSGKVKRIYKGKRFYTSITYPYLLDTQRETINSLLQLQRLQGFLPAKIDTPFGVFEGNVILELNNNQSRFTYSQVLGDYVWTNWELSIKAVDYDS